MAASSNPTVIFPDSKLRIWVFLCLIGIASAQLTSTYYEECPRALVKIKLAVSAAALNETRMAASLLRLHFHDCFVQGCDGSVLLDDTPTFTGEKNAFPNANSLRGFDVIENIKSTLEAICPGVVSCADIVAIAARDSVVALGGPGWNVLVGRKDSTTASLSGANSDLPAPFLDLSGLIAAFAKKNFTVQEMVALSGAHTIGKAKCSSFKTRIYNESNIDPSFAKALQANCPRTGGDNQLSNIDTTTPNLFDNAYYWNLVNKKGLFHSDQQLFNGGSTDSQVKSYSWDLFRFRRDFANAMQKMSNLSPLTGDHGQIRRKCSKVN